MSADPNDDTDGVLKRFATAVETCDREDMDRMIADDAVLIGIARCKGRPCTGKADIRQRFLAKMLPPKPFSVAVTRRHDRRIWADWSLRLPEANVKISDQIRGSLILTARDGQIAHLVFNYDLADPSTVLARANQGELAFALQDAAGVRNTPMRVLLAPYGDETAVVVHINDETRTQLSAAIHHSEGRELGDVAYPLSAFAEDRSDTSLQLPIDSLFTNRYSVVVRDHAGSMCACARIPSPKTLPKKPA